VSNSCSSQGKGYTINEKNYVGTFSEFTKYRLFIPNNDVSMSAKGRCKEITTAKDYEYGYRKGS
jgi:hypothetical protein